VARHGRAAQASQARKLAVCHGRADPADRSSSSLHGARNMRHRGCNGGMLLFEDAARPLPARPLPARSLPARPMRQCTPKSTAPDIERSRMWLRMSKPIRRRAWAEEPKNRRVRAWRFSAVRRGHISWRKRCGVEYRKPAYLGRKTGPRLWPGPRVLEVTDTGPYLGRVQSDKR
jgi:hypothetical protein